MRSSLHSIGRGMVVQAMQVPVFCPKANDEKIAVADILILRANCLQIRVISVKRLLIQRFYDILRMWTNWNLRRCFL